MATIISPNMNLTIPGVGSTDGPIYAQNVNNSLTLVDGHDHSPGYGVYISQTGISLTGDLPMNGNNLITIRSTRYNNQSSALALGTDVLCTYVINGNFYYNNGTGFAVQLTNGNSIVGTAGSISGLPSGTASASYNAGSGSFSFQSSTNIQANINAQNITLSNDVANSYSLTLMPPASMSSNLTITLPTPPGSSEVLTMDNSGTITPNTYDYVGEQMSSAAANSIIGNVTSVSSTVANIIVESSTTAAANYIGETMNFVGATAVIDSIDACSVASANIIGEAMQTPGANSILNQVTSVSSNFANNIIAATINNAGANTIYGNISTHLTFNGTSGSFSTTSSTPVPVTNLSVTINATGKPILIMLIAGGGGGNSSISIQSGGGPGFVEIYKDGSPGWNNQFIATDGVTVPPSCVSGFDLAPGVGTHTYAAYAYASGNNIFVTNVTIIAFEVGG